MPLDMSRHLQTGFRSMLHEFAESPKTFQVVNSIPKQQSHIAAKSLYVLDSSFNPPSKAHALLAKNALNSDHGSKPARLLLLLATENADKKPKPALFEDRLVMMTLLGQELHESMAEAPAIDIAITKKPYFADKAKSIDDSGVYGDVEQVHLIGFDTVVRVFDPKYYAPDVKLRALDPFLSKHRLRANYRLGDKFGTREDQQRYLESIGNGSREAEGMRREWKDRVEMVDDAEDGAHISSTEARNAASQKDYEGLQEFVGEAVNSYIQDMRLYQENASDTKI